MNYNLCQHHILSDMYAPMERCVCVLWSCWRGKRLAQVLVNTFDKLWEAFSTLTAEKQQQRHTHTSTCYINICRQHMQIGLHTNIQNKTHIYTTQAFSVEASWAVRSIGESISQQLFKPGFWYPVRKMSQCSSSSKQQFTHYLCDLNIKNGNY